MDPTRILPKAEQNPTPPCRSCEKGTCVVVGVSTGKGDLPAVIVTFVCQTCRHRFDELWASEQLFPGRRQA
jgi:hypothetical protein